MAPTVRPIQSADVPAAGRICYEAFAAIANEHNFPPDFPNADVATGLVGRLITHPGVYGIVAELDGEIIGSNFVDERSAIVGLGPITVDPSAQNRGAGAALMTHMIERAERNNAAGLRLIQAGYHRRSLCLYAKLGFTVREPLVNLQGSPPGVVVPGCAVRAAVIDDAAAADRLCTARCMGMTGAAISAMRLNKGLRPSSSAVGVLPAIPRRSPFSATPSRRPTRI